MKYLLSVALMLVLCVASHACPPTVGFASAGCAQTFAVQQPCVQQFAVQQQFAAVPAYGVGFNTFGVSPFVGGFGFRRAAFVSPFGFGLGFGGVRVGHFGGVRVGVGIGF